MRRKLRESFGVPNFIGRGSPGKQVDSFWSLGMIVYLSTGRCPEEIGNDKKMAIAPCQDDSYEIFVLPTPRPFEMLALSLDIMYCNQGNEVYNPTEIKK